MFRKKPIIQVNIYQYNHTGSVKYELLQGEGTILLLRDTISVFYLQLFTFPSVLAVLSPTLCPSSNLPTIVRTITELSSELAEKNTRTERNVKTMTALSELAKLSEISFLQILCGTSNLTTTVRTVPEVGHYALCPFPCSTCVCGRGNK